MRVLHLLMGILLTRLHASHQLYYQTCQDYTIDKCTYDQNGLIETLKDIDESSCQFFCDVVYKGLCNFFIYDHQQVMCELLQEPFGNYVDSCHKAGGPPSPSIDFCEKSADPCKVFIFVFSNRYFHIMIVKRLCIHIVKKSILYFYRSFLKGIVDMREIF